MGWNSQIFQLLIVSASSGFSGFFVYSPSPGAGNLIYSVTSPGGPATDPYGNAILAVATMYGGTPAGGTGPSKIQLTSSGGVLLQNFYTGTASEAAPGQLKIGAVNIGTPNEEQQLILGAPVNAASNDGVFIDLASSTTAGPSTGTGLLAYQKAAGGDVNLLTWGAGGVTRGTLAGFTGSVPAQQTDGFTRTVTTTGVNQITFGYGINGSDPLVQSHNVTVYRIRGWGTGTEAGGAAVALSAWLQNFGLNTSILPTGTNPGATGLTFQWLIDAWVQVETLGVAGSALVGGQVTMDDSAGNKTAFPIAVTSYTVDTTTAWTLALAVGWVSVVGAPTISCIGSVMTREGP